MKHPPTHITNKLAVTHSINARHTAGRFAFVFLPGVIPFQLTKVNKCILYSYKPASYIYTLLLFQGLKMQKLTKWATHVKPNNPLTTRLTK